MEPIITCALRERTLLLPVTAFLFMANIYGSSGSVEGTATFSVLDFPRCISRNRSNNPTNVPQRADYDKTMQTLTAHAERAKAAYDSAVLISQNTPVELEAARLGETQASARYQAALAPIVEVAEAQRLLLQAETEDNLARLTVWRAMLGEALAQGDLQPFLELARKRAAGGQ